jgi:hypothetical protein
MRLVLMAYQFQDLSIKNIGQNSIPYIEQVSFTSCIKLIKLIDRASSSHVGPIAVGIFPKEEKVAQEEFSGPQAPCSE